MKDNRSDNLGRSSRQGLFLKYGTSGSRIIFLDYDGTLVPFVDEPQDAVPDEQLLGLLRRLAGDPGNDVVIISGRDRATLSGWFGPLDLNLIAEHGAWIRPAGGEWRMSGTGTYDWKPVLLKAIRMHADRLPGSFVEEKDFSIAWHYRRSDQGLASIRVKELVEDLAPLARDAGVQVMQGARVIEIKDPCVNKGAAAVHFLSLKGYDFILAIGDDLTDEDMFMVMPEGAFSIKVGDGRSHARYNLMDCKEVRRLIEEIVG